MYEIVRNIFNLIVIWCRLLNGIDEECLHICAPSYVVLYFLCFFMSIGEDIEPDLVKLKIFLSSLACLSNGLV